MQLHKLTEEIPGLCLMGNPWVEIDSIAYDSRKVTPGSLFVALKGRKSNGVDFAREAKKKGAVAVMLSEESVRGREKLCSESSVSLIISGEPRRDMALMACKFYGSPTDKLKLIGVTGTNGKTTTTYLTESVFKAAGRKTGVIGTISYRDANSEEAADQTTPESVDLQRMFRDMAEAGAEFCLLEVSSHALEMERVSGSRFETAVFTNLSQDHLDFHKDMENYFKAKRRMFQQFQVGAAIVNTDDPWGQRLAADFSGNKFTYGLNSEADFSALEPSISMEGLEFTLISPEGRFPIKSTLTGRHNINNILAASAIALSAGIDISHVQSGIASLGFVPGRFQKVDEGQNFAVIVDYAHTDDALRKLLEAIRSICGGKLIVLFGCGGDRDKGKRPLMGKAAAELSDFAVITSDNPRSEDPMSIIAQIERGFLDAGNRKDAYMIVAERKEAIHEAVSKAGAGDVVVIAGKGHEKYQVVGDRRFPFDDVEEAGQAINATASRKVR